MNTNALLFEALNALEQVKYELRALDLAYGSTAYIKANNISNKLRQTLIDLESSNIRKEWETTYKSFIGAFDTPIARRRNDSEFANDARRRMREFDALIKETK